MLKMGIGRPTQYLGNVCTDIKKRTMKTYLRLCFALIGMISFAGSTYSQEITMFNGFFGMSYYVDTVKTSKQDIASLMQSDANANLLWTKAQRQLTTAFVSSGVQIGFLIWYVAELESLHGDLTAPAIGLVGATVASMGFALASMNSRRRAILSYNHAKTVYRLCPTNDGIGLVVSF